MTDYAVAKRTSVIHIYKSLCNVCGSAAVDTSTVGRWVKRVTASETGKAKLHDQPRSGRTLFAASPEMPQGADAIVHVD